MHSDQFKPKFYLKLIKKYIFSKGEQFPLTRLLRKVYIHPIRVSELRQDTVLQPSDANCEHRCIIFSRKMSANIICLPFGGTGVHFPRDREALLQSQRVRNSPWYSRCTGPGGAPGTRLHVPAHTAIGPRRLARWRSAVGWTYCQRRQIGPVPR